MQKLTAKSIETYLTENYGQCRHNAVAMAKSCQKTAKKFKVKPTDVFHFVVESEPIGHSHSYGFHTAYGREIMNTFEQHYYEFND